MLTESNANSSADLALSPGFAVYPGLRRGGACGECRRTEAVLEGFVVGYFRQDGLLDDVFGSGFDPAIDFELYDGADVASSSLLYDEDGVERAGEEGYDPLFSEKNRFGVAGREWSLYFATLPGFEKGAESNLPAFVLASGIGASVLLFGISWMLVRSRIPGRAREQGPGGSQQGTGRDQQGARGVLLFRLPRPEGPLEGHRRLLPDIAGGLRARARRRGNGLPRSSEGGERAHGHP